MITSSDQCSDQSSAKQVVSAAPSPEHISTLIIRSNHEKPEFSINFQKSRHIRSRWEQKFAKTLMTELKCETMAFSFSDKGSVTANEMMQVKAASWRVDDRERTLAFLPTYLSVGSSLRYHVTSLVILSINEGKHSTHALLLVRPSICLRF